MINLENFDEKNVNHRNLLETLSSDENVKRGILIVNDLTYVIREEQEFIGLIKLNKECGDNYSIDMGILEQYRNNGYESLALKQVRDCVEKFNKFLIRTDYNDQDTINVSKEAGYRIDYEENERSMDEGEDCLVLSYQERKN